MPSYEVYHRAFEIGEVGSAAAVGVTLTVIIFALNLAVARIGEGGAMISRAERSANYAILLLFAVFAL